MLGTKHDHDFTLEELIGIINSRVSGRLPSLTEKQEKCDRIIAKHILSSTETTAIRWLHFKPWSGTNDSSAAIREEIEQQSESEGEGEGEGLIEIGATDKLV